ncbi:MAG: hypothetical protein JW904_15360 [Spirochaetales bacterium]|nr:hypothetical protein [Spirochaetales bacterium]
MKKIFLILLIVVIAGSCSLSTRETFPLPQDLADATGQTVAARGVVTTGQLGPFYDYDAQGLAYMEGRIETSIHYAYSVDSGDFVTALLDKEEVLIGGGARVASSYPSLNTGGLLIKSYPRFVYDSEQGFDWGYGWSVQSKNHSASSGMFYTIAYAVGIRLKKADGSYMTKDLVQRYIKYISKDGLYSINPKAEVDCPAGYAFTAGGAEIIPFDNYQDNYITACYAADVGNTGIYDRGGKWVVQAKSSATYSVAKARSWGVVIKTLDGTDNTIPGFGDIRVQHVGLPGKITSGPGRNSTVTVEGVPTLFTTHTGYSGNYLIPNSMGYLVTGVGAMTEFSGNTYNTDGRFLTSMHPTYDGVGAYVSDKDHIVKDSGILSAQFMMINFDYNSDN